MTLYYVSEEFGTRHDTLNPHNCTTKINEDNSKDITAESLSSLSYFLSLSLFY